MREMKTKDKWGVLQAVLIDHLVHLMNSIIMINHYKSMKILLKYK